MIKYICNKKFKLWKLEITITWRSKKSLMGRFGGGWNWELGFQSSRTTIIFNLLILSVRIYLNLKD